MPVTGVDRYGEFRFSPNISPDKILPFKMASKKTTEEQGVYIATTSHKPPVTVLRML